MLYLRLNIPRCGSDKGGVRRTESGGHLLWSIRIWVQNKLGNRRDSSGWQRVRIQVACSSWCPSVTWRLCWAPWCWVPCVFCCRRMSPVGRDGHGYDGCTCKEKIVEQDLLLWYVCIRRGGGLLHLNLAVAFNYLLAFC